MKNKKHICVYLLLPVLLFCNKVAAQLPVSKEAHHRVVLENEYVRLLEGNIPVHDTTPAHIHAKNSVVVFLSNSTFGIQVACDTPVIAEVKPGAMRYVGYGDKPVTHIVWNQGLPVLHFLVVELLKQYPGVDTCAILSVQGVKFEWQQKLVRAYNVAMTKDRRYSLPKSNCAYLLIDISGVITAVSSGSIRSLQTGGFVFFAPQTDIEINGSNKENAQCVLLELK